VPEGNEPQEGLGLTVTVTRVGAGGAEGIGDEQLEGIYAGRKIAYR